MPEARKYHISSAVISVIPERCDEVLLEISQLENVETYARDKGKIVVVIEGHHTGMLGDTLVTLSNLRGVIAANMVFEHIVSEEEDEHEQRIFAT